MQNNLPLQTTEHLLNQIGWVLLQERFYSYDSWIEYKLIIGDSWSIYYSIQNGKLTLLWSKSTPEIWIWKPIYVSSLWYFIWEEWIVRMNLDTWDINLKLSFLDIGIWLVSRIDIINTIIFWSHGICKFWEDRETMRIIMGELMTNNIYGNVERSILWKYTSEQLWIGHLEEIFSDVYGKVIIWKQWIAFCDRDGNLLFKKEYSELWLKKIIQVYTNWWIIGQNEKVQLNYKEGALLNPITPINIEDFLEFQKENSRSLMKPLDWIVIPEKSQSQTIVQAVSESTIRNLTNEDI